MRKIGWLLATIGSAALVGAAAALSVAAASADRRPATVLRFDTMTPVTGPHVGPGTPLRGVPGGGLP